MLKGFDRRLMEHFDWPIMWLVVTISIIGLFNLYSATFNLPSSKYFFSQLYWLLMAIAVVLLTISVDYRVLERIAYPLYVVLLLLLVFVLIKGRYISGSRRWIDLGIFSFQPSELAKIVVILAMAKYLQSREKVQSMGMLELILPAGLSCAIAVSILLEPDLGTAMLIVLISFSMLLIAGIRWKTFVALVIAFSVIVPISWMFILKDYQKQRVYGFLNPEKDPLGAGYQVIQSKIAVGSGLLFGKGYLEGTQSKLQFLPKQHTDFIMSNYSEEWGFFGSTVLLLLFGTFLFKCLSVAFNAKEKFGSLLAFGLCAFFFWQIFINIGMELGMLPVVGMTLPFFSYGGSSMITNMIAVGLVLNISMRRYMF